MSTAPTPHLNPCPFCGVEPKWKDSGGDLGYTSSSSTIQCVNPACIIQPSIKRDTEGYDFAKGKRYAIDPRQEMAKAWNGDTK